MSVDDVARELDVDVNEGLTQAAARVRLADLGPNELIEHPAQSWWKRVARQLSNGMTAVLAVAVLITLAIGDATDALVITVIVVLNTGIGWVQEGRAERAMASLRTFAADRATVVRGGEVLEVPTVEIVRGDLVRIEAGDVIPADLRLVVVRGLRTNEASLTGESVPIAKTVDPLANAAPGIIPDYRNMAFKGTSVSDGHGTGVVVATGMETELGRIAELLQSDAGGPTPLQRRLAKLARWLGLVAAVVCVVVFVQGVAVGEEVREMLVTSISLAVAAIPEGLPAVVTVALALGARRMAERNAICRRLPAVETLGSVTVICTDKTGTLTEQEMAIERVWTPSGLSAVSGSGYRPEGRVDRLEGAPDLGEVARVARIGAACNNAVLHAPHTDDGEWTIIGDPTEGALLVLAARVGVDRSELDGDHPRCAEIPFDASRRRMTTAHRATGSIWLAAKGALESLAPLLRVEDGEALERAREASHAFTNEGYRVLALADRTLREVPHRLEDAEVDLRLAGLVAIADPPRPEVAEAVAACRTAGITPIMITGDHPRTARAIGRRVGLLDGSRQTVITGTELDALNDSELGAHIDEIAIFARTNPAHKLRIVHALKRAGAVVAMTGDGVNDAPALQSADIGIAMGAKGTDVSKEAADMVLVDDNFATIVHAVEEGRRIYDNIRRVVRYLLTTNAGELLVMLLAPLLGLPIPLLAVQILWINLVTDGLPAIALGLEPAEPDTMRRPPRPTQDSIVSRSLWQHALWVGAVMAAVTLALQAVARANGWPWQTMVFATLALLQLGHALAVRSECQSTFTLGFRTNPTMIAAVVLGALAQLAIVYVPQLQETFHTESLTLGQLAVVGLLSTTVFVAVELEKVSRRHRLEAR